MNNRLRLEVKALTEEGTFEGVLSAYNVVDNGGDIVEPGAFAKSIQEHGAERPLLWQHKPDCPIGKLTLHDTPEAMLVSGKLLMDLPEAQKAYALLKAGIVRGLSIGYVAVKKKMDGAIRRLKEIKLYEGSLVTFPMNEAALITSVKADGQKDSFVDELVQRQLIDAPDQMLYSLGDALRSIVWSDVSDDEKKTAAAETIQQFSDAYLAWLPRYLTMRAEDDGDELKAGRTISSATRQCLTKACDQMKAARTLHDSAHEMISALLAEEADDGKAIDTSTLEAANKPEPVNHSAIDKQLTELKEVLSWMRSK